MTDKTDSPEVSFIVIAYNEAAGIARAVRSILRQEGPHSREVIVVDDGSTDGTAAVIDELAERNPELQLVRLQPNRGRGFARDAGVRRARGRVLATVDADVILPPVWLSRCLEELATADAVGGTAVPDGDVAYLFARFGLSPRAVPHTTAVTGSNAAYRRDVFDRISFDVQLRDGEDVALNHALTEIGARVVTIPGLRVEHRENKTFTEALAWSYQSGRGATRQLCRYRRVRRPDVIFGGWLLSSIAAASPRFRGRRNATAVPLAYLTAAASAHVCRAFVWQRRAGHRMFGAILIDMALLSSYFLGRLAGVRSMLTRESRRVA